MANEKLRPKYLVTRIKDDGVPASFSQRSTNPEDPSSPFVLMPMKDPAAYEAMFFYAQLCEPDLAAEIRDWLRLIAEAPPLYGTQGVRNRMAIRLRQIDSLV